MLLADAAGRDEPLVGVRRRHADVDDRDVRLLCERRGPQELVGVGGLADHVDARVGEQPGESRPDEHDVVGDYDAHGITAVTVDVRSCGSTVSLSADRADPVVEVGVVGRGRPAETVLGGHRDDQQRHRWRHFDVRCRCRRLLEACSNAAATVA